MRNFKGAILADIEKEEELLRKYGKIFKESPEGGLSVYRKGNNAYFKIVVYSCDEDTGETVRKQTAIKVGDPMLKCYMEKSFARKMVEILSKNIKIQRKLLSTYRSYDFESVIKSLPTYCSEMSNFVRSTAGVVDIAEKQRNASMRARNPEGLCQPTMAGFNVRSKSEALLVNAFVERGITFVYEEPLELEDENGETIMVYPDFTIYFPDGRVIIWEQAGLLMNQGYLHNFTKKIQLYHRNGFTIGNNLIITADDKNGHLDLSAVIRNLDLICGRK